MEGKKVEKLNFKKISKENLGKSIDRSGYKIYNDKSLKEKSSTNDNKSNLPDKPAFVSSKSMKLTIQDEKQAIIDKVFAPKKPRPKICHICGNQIKNEFFVYKYLSKRIDVCDNCYMYKTKCENCGIPLKLVKPGTSMKYCEFCKLGGECRSCGQKVSGRDSIRIEHTRGIFCKTCISEAPRCWGCGNPVKKGSQQLADGRVICSECLKEAIKSRSDASMYIHRMLDTLTSLLSGPKVNSLPVMFKDYKDYIKQNKEDELIVFKKSGDDTYLETVPYILKPQMIKAVCLFYSTIFLNLIAIKQGHHIENNILIPFQRFCSSIMLIEYDYVDEYFRLQNTKDKYDRLYRLFFSQYKKLGAKGVIERLVKEIVECR